MAASRVVLPAAEVLSRSSARAESQHWFVAGAGVPGIPCALAETTAIARIIIVAISLMGSPCSWYPDNAARAPVFRTMSHRPPLGLVKQVCVVERVHIVRNSFGARALATAVNGESPMAPRYDEEHNTTLQNSHNKRPPWKIIVLGAALLAVAAVIFSAAGPDRSRTTEYKDTIPSAVNPRGVTTEKTVPNVDMPTAPRSR